MLNENDLNDLLSIACEAAIKAGVFLKDFRASGVVVEFDEGKDVKLIADKKSEEIFIRFLMERSSFPILSEERGWVEGRQKDTDLCWIVDPLDGSLNYLRDIPICCTSIGLWCGETPLLGAIYDFNREELFSGIVGIGASLNSHPIRTSAALDISAAVLCTGFPVSTDFSSYALQRLVEQIQRYRKIRLIGSAALSLAYVAAGRADCYYEKDIRLWDVAAGIAIVKAAGGQTVWSPSVHEYVLSLCAANEFLPPVF
ncbi:MAG: inositol monophosphatase [Deltaproteobacteria bacterium]|nr:inositol monophosphatase [Deltaproteobacteria bacterium]